MNNREVKHPHSNDNRETYTGGIGAALVLVVIFVLLVALGVFVDSCYGQDLEEELVFPVASRTAGKAETQWRAGICLHNPRSSPTYAEVVIMQNADQYGIRFPLEGGETLCGNDFILGWLGLADFAGGVVVRSPAIVASLWEYNDTGDGTMSVEIAGFPVLEDQRAYEATHLHPGAAGVQNYGRPGESGFRASVGAFNPHRELQEIEFRVSDELGREIWNRGLDIPGRSQRQIGLPPEIEVWDGSAAASNISPDPGRVYGYLTVTDNQTGSGVFKPMLIPAAGAVSRWGHE